MSATDASPPTRTTPALDRSFQLHGTHLLLLGWAIAIAAAVALRLARLDQWALSRREAAMALDAFHLYTGQAGSTVSNVAPLSLMLDVFSFFLFGVSDATFRLVDAIAGLAMLPLALALPPRGIRTISWGMATKIAVSPTLVFASRTGDGEMLAATFLLAAVACLLCIGRPGNDDAAERRLAIGIGLALAAAFASSPAALLSFLTILIGIAFSVLRVPEGQVRTALKALAAPSRWIPALAAFAAATVVFFTRFFSAPGAIAGVPETIGNAIAIVIHQQPDRLGIMLVLMLVLYEPVSVLLSFVVGHNVKAPLASLRMLLAAWLVSAVLLYGFAAGAEPHHIVYISMPLVLMGGIGLGGLVIGIDWRDVRQGRGLALLLAYFGALVAAIAAIVLFGRARGSGGGIGAALPAVAIIMVVFVPLLYAASRLAASERKDGLTKQPKRLAMMAYVLAIAVWAISTSTHFVLERQGSGKEPLARHQSTAAVKPTVERLHRLARDVGVTSGSVRDPAGGHGLSVAIGEQVEQPWAWYLRDFPDAKVVPAGSAGSQGAQVAIAPAGEDLALAGYTVSDVPWITSVPAAYAQPDLPDLLKRIVLPEYWLQDLRFLFFREGITVPPPESVSLGLGRDLAAKVAPSSGPYTLQDRPGPGAAQGQFDGPVGVAVGADGMTYAMDSGNARLQRFSPSGEYLGAWGNGEGGVTLASPGIGLGPTGVSVAPDGAVWIADTWNHRVLALSPAGGVVTEIGSPDLAPSDTGDDPNAVLREPGLFFGPRDIAATRDKVFVADTGNERIQVFDRDGRFLTAFGGFGNQPGQLIEPVGVAIGPDGDVYVADSGNQRVSVFTPEGEPVRQFVVAAWPPPDPTGMRPFYQPYLAFGPDGVLYASSSESASVQALDPAGGDLLGTVAMAGNERLDQPMGVAFAPDGRLVIADHGLNAILSTTPPPVELPPPAVAATPVG